MMPPSANAKGNSPLIRKLSALALLQDEHIHVLEKLQTCREWHERTEDVIRTGDDYSRIYVLQSGWAMRSKLLADGRRQVINFDLPGDFMCVNACLMRRSMYTITLLDDTTVSVIEIPEFLHLMHRYPSLGALIQWMCAREKSFLIEHLVSLGRRTAYERLAHVLLDLSRRLELLELVKERNFYIPVTQALLADLLGLSTVHVCRTFSRLEADGMLRAQTSRRGMVVEFLDYDGLCQAAGVEGDFCHLTEISADARRTIETVGSVAAIATSDNWRHALR